MCMDFTNINKACPKDSIPLTKIDQLVESTTKSEFYSFYDTFLWYNQIKMHLDVQEKTAIITNFRL